MRKSASFVPQRHSRTSVTLRTAGEGGPLEEPLACIQLGLEFSLPVVWQRGKHPAPKQQYALPLLPTPLGNQARFWLRK